VLLHRYPILCATSGAIRSMTAIKQPTTANSISGQAFYEHWKTRTRNRNNGCLHRARSAALHTIGGLAQDRPRCKDSGISGRTSKERDSKSGRRKAPLIRLYSCVSPSIRWSLLIIMHCWMGILWWRSFPTVAAMAKLLSGASAVAFDNTAVPQPARSRLQQ
jgi:hypothetical protein